MARIDSSGVTEVLEKLAQVELDPWEQQRGEPDQAYHAFQVYKSLPPDKRKYGEVAKQYNTSVGASVAERTFYSWGTHYRWKQRASAWDHEVDKLVQEKYKDDIVRMRQEHAQEARLLQALGTMGIRYWIEQARKDPSVLGRINVQTLITMVAEGERLERQARLGDERHSTEPKLPFTIVIMPQGQQSSRLALPVVEGEVIEVCTDMPIIIEQEDTHEHTDT